MNHPDHTYNPQAFTNRKTSGDNIQCCCPFHVEGAASFGILTEYPYTCNCFSCGEGGSLARLVQYALNLSTIVHGEHYIERHYANVSIEQRTKIDLLSILDKSSLDRKCSHLQNDLDKYLGKRHPYMYTRGFSERTLNKYEIGFDTYSSSMVFPIRTSKGYIRFFKKRSVLSKQFLNEVNIEKKDVIYGLYYLLHANSTVPEIYLNESETDTMSCYQGGLPAGALLGRVLFDAQIKELLRAGVKKVNLFYDNDLYGLKATLRSFELLSNYPFHINVVQYPGAKFGIDTFNNDDIIYKDANILLKANKLPQIELVPFEMLNVNWEKIKEI